jgi:hypothetical protein
MKKLFSLIFMLSAGTGIAMEEDNAITPIDNGLLTELDATVARTECLGWFANNREITKLKKERGTLVTLMRYREVESLGKGANPVTLFCPIVFKETDGSLENLGQFRRKQHRELKEACRQNKALYFDFKQGVLIYGLYSQPSPHLCTLHKQTIQNSLEASAPDIQLN